MDSVQLQYLDAGEVRQGEEMRHEIILMAAESRDIQEHLDLLAACELTPAAIDATPAALARCAAGRSELPVDAPAQVILDIGQSHSKITITRQGRIVFFKIIEIGGKTFDLAVAEQLNLPMDEAGEVRKSCLRDTDGTSQSIGDDMLFGAGKRDNVSRAIYESLRDSVGELAREVSLCLRYYSVTFRGKKPESLILTGGESGQAHIPGILADGTSIAVQSCPTLDQLDWSAALHAKDTSMGSGQWAVAAGLAMRHDSLLSIRGAA